MKDVSNRIVIVGNTLQNTVGLVRSLGESGLLVDLILEPCRRSQCFVRFSKYLKKIYFQKENEDVVRVLLDEFATEGLKTIVLCGSDSAISLLDKNYDRLKDHFYTFNASDCQGRINFFLDKCNVFPLALQCGLDLIKTWQVRRGNVPDDICFPCFVKGRNSVLSSKADIKVCKDRATLENFLRPGISYLVQEYIQKEYEININGLSINHGKHVFLPGVVFKIRESLMRQGEYMRLDDVGTYEDLNVGGIQKLLELIGYEGLFSIEFLKRGTKYYFLEINLRNDGLNYIYTAAGANLPLIWVYYASGLLGDINEKRVRVDTPFYLMHENDMYNIIEGHVSFFRWVRDFRRSQAFFLMNARDPLPFMYSTWIHFKQLMKKLIRQVFRIRIP